MKECSSYLYKSRIHILNLSKNAKDALEISQRYSSHRYSLFHFKNNYCMNHSFVGQILFYSINVNSFI